MPRLGDSAAGGGGGCWGGGGRPSGVLATRAPVGHVGLSTRDEARKLWPAVVAELGGG